MDGTTKTPVSHTAKTTAKLSLSELLNSALDEDDQAARVSSDDRDRYIREEEDGYSG
jgi:hypothetical protein